MEAHAGIRLDAGALAIDPLGEVRLELPERGEISGRVRHAAGIVLFAGRRAVREGGLQTFEEAAILFDVDEGARIEHHEEGEQERQEIGVGQQPAIALARWFGPLRRRETALGFHRDPSFGSRWARSRRSRVRGERPDCRAIVPSTIISSSACWNAARLRIFAAIGSSTKFAMPTP